MSAPAHPTTPRQMRDGLAALPRPDRPAWLLEVLRREAAGGKQSPPVLSLIVSHPDLLRGVLETLAAEAAHRAYALSILARLFNRQENFADLRGVLRQAAGVSPDRPEIRREWLRVELLAPPAAEEAWQLCTPALTPLGALSYTMQRRVAAGEAPEGGEFLTALAARVASLDRAAFPPALARVAAAREVALVGNGSGTRGRGLAAEIEAHDAVVRINYPMLTGFEADVGARTDAMVFAEEKRPDLPVLMAREPGHPSHPAMSLRTAARRADPALRPPAVPPGIGPLVAEITYERPTTGFFATILIALLLRRPLTLYGFDFFRPDAQGHYFGTATGALRHELAYERWFTGAVLPVLFPGLRRVE